MDRKHVISVMVSNHSGVLTRVSGLFARRGYNIDSLSVCTTEDVNFSRMTIVTTGDDYVLEQITNQLDKLEDVKQVTELKQDNAILRELLLIKIKVLPSQRPEIESTANLFKARIVDTSLNCCTIEKTGEGNKIDNLIKILEPYGIIEMARTGLTALERGATSIKDYRDYNKEI